MFIRGGGFLKYYGIKRRKRKEKVMYKIVKLTRFISQYTTINAKMREHRRIDYKNEFIEPFRFRNADSSIPTEKYLTPVCIITTDIILRENIPQLKKGIVKLLKRNYSHKYYGSQRSIDEILSNVEKMDDTLTSWFNSIDVGRFDFDGEGKLKNQISHFDLYIKNINTSYLAVEFHLYPTERFRDELEKIINDDYVHGDYMAIAKEQLRNRILEITISFITFWYDMYYDNLWV